MRPTSRNARHRPWAAALVGSAAVALAIAVVLWTASNAVVATIAVIAVLMIVALALSSSRRECEPRDRPATSRVDGRT
jgi:Flp pilus assembly protein TadB